MSNVQVRRIRAAGSGNQPVRRVPHSKNSTDVQLQIAPDDMMRLARATELSKKYRNGEITARQYEAEKVQALAFLNRLDIASAAKRVDTYRAYGYVPTYRHNGTLNIPHVKKTDVNGNALTGIGVKDRSLPVRLNHDMTILKIAGASKGSSYMPVCGRKHLAIIGWVTRPRLPSGKIDWTPGNLRPRMQVQSSVFGWFQNGRGKWVPITKKSTSRLKQYIFNTKPAGMYRDNRNYKAGKDNRQKGDFIFKRNDAFALKEGEKIAIVSTKKGPVLRIVNPCAKDVRGITGLSKSQKARYCNVWGLTTSVPLSSKGKEVIQDNEEGSLMDTSDARGAKRGREEGEGPSIEGQ